MEELLKEIRQYRKEQAELFEWTKKNGHPKMASFDEGGLNACDKIIAIVARALAKSSDESSNCNNPHVSSSLPQKCNCGQNCLPYDAVFTIKKCKRCGNDC